MNNQNTCKIPIKKVFEARFPPRIHLNGCLTKAELLGTIYNRNCFLFYEGNTMKKIIFTSLLLVVPFCRAADPHEGWNRAIEAIPNL